MTTDHVEGGGSTAGDDRELLEIAPDVVRELVHRSVAPGRFLLQSLQNDVVQVAGEMTPEPRHGRSAQECCLRRARARDDRARRVRIHPGHHSQNLLGCPGFEPQRPRSREELVEDHAERIHVGRGRDRLAAELLGARVGRRQTLEAGRGRERFDGRLRLEELRDAEVEQLGRTSAATRMLSDFRSRWTTSLWCAN